MRVFFWIFYVCIFFPIEVLKSSFQMALIVLFPKNSVKPGIVAIPIDLKTDWGIAVLANTITLTPGTLTLDVSKDKRYLYVHCIALRNRNIFIKNIKDSYEHKVKILEGSL